MHCARFSVLPLLGLLLLFAPCAQARDVVRLPVPYMQQPDGNTCLPTSLCMAMHFLGRCDLTTETVYQLHKTCRYDRYNVPKFIGEYDLHCFPSWLEHAWTRQTVEAELRAGRPVILGLDCSRAGHFVLAVGYTDDGRVIIHDPYWKEPGWYFGGPFVTTDWERLIWRNGILVRPEPFPPAPRRISATLVDSTAPRTMMRGQQAYAEFAIKNNGQEPWPEGVQLAAVDAYSSPVRERVSPFAILPEKEGEHTSATWISASRAAFPDKSCLAPGEVAVFRVPLRAPGNLWEGRAEVFRENFNLIDAQGRWFSEHWQSGPSNRQIFFRVAVIPGRALSFSYPLEERLHEGKPNLGWNFKIGGADVLSVASDAPPFPGSSQGANGASQDASTTGAALSALVKAKPPTPPLRLRPAPGEEFEVAYLGDPLGTDYRVESWIYCDYRPQDAARGYDRVGLFLRDSGQHRIAPKTETESGECLIMAYDTDNGRLRTGTFAIGGFGGSSRETSATFIRESGWHHFAIRAEGTSVTYELDGCQIGALNLARRESHDDEPQLYRAFGAGDCGVFCRSTYPEEAERRRGLLFSGFRIEL